MLLAKSKNSDINYLSKIVDIKSFHPHSDPEVNKLKCCTVDGFNVITGIDSQPGLYVYFPAMSRINPDFLSYANLFRHKDLNRDPNQTGMFDDNGKVKAIKLRGEISEGFILPVAVLQNYVVSVTNKELSNVEDGVEFDVVANGTKEFWISKKFIAKHTIPNTIAKGGKITKKVKKGLNKVIDTQFRFHYDTVLIKKVPNVITPNSRIQISYKIHGTSGISARVLCRHPLTWKQKIAKWLTGEEFNVYDGIYASRTVIKNKYYNKAVTPGFYGVDVWKRADDIVGPILEDGMTAYYEIVGYLPNGNYIQKGYDYGCVPPSIVRKFPPEEDRPYYISNPDGTHTFYKEEKHFKVRIYRLTYTNVDGKVFEFSPHQVQHWCKKVGLTPVEECYCGLAKDLYPDIKIDENWNSNFLDRLSNDKKFFMECDSPHCNNKVPHEGLVIKIDDGITRAFKLKCFRFLNKEQQQLDKGEENIEDNA